jgi:hypothetical protein
MPIDPSKVAWDAPDPKAVKWDAPATTGKRKPPSTLDVLASAPYEAIAGLGDMFYGAPQNLYNLGAAAIGTGATAIGYPEFAPEVEAPPTPVRNFLQQQGLIRDLSGMTPGQRVLNTGVQAVTGGLISPASSGPQFAANALKAGVGGVTGELTSQATDNPYMGMAVGMAVPGVISARQQGVVARRDAEQAQNSVREATLRAAQAEGLIAPPGNVRPTVVNRTVERIAGRPELEQLMSASNQSDFDRLARRAVGIADDADLTPDAMAAVRREAATQGYDPVANVGNIPVDNNYLTALQNIETRYVGAARSFPGAVPNDVRRIVNENLVNDFDSADAIARIRSLREDASAAYRRGDNNIGQANNAVARALEDQIERHLSNAGQQGAQMLTNFREARRRMAISHTLEDAMREGTGSVDARKLAAALNKGAPLTGDLRTMAQFANTFPKVSAGISGTPGVTNSLGQPSLSGLAGAALGGFFGGYQGAGAGAALGQYGPQVTRAAAQRYLMSDMAQSNALAPRAGNLRRGMAMDPVLYNYLTGQAIAEQ